MPYVNAPSFSIALYGGRIDASDYTALSAKRVKELKLKNTAAIANEYAAKRFGLYLEVNQTEEALYRLPHPDEA
ncbi:MAG: hypothetical protein QM762_25810 [Chryseolinea sp.]